MREREMSKRTFETIEQNELYWTEIGGEKIYDI